MANAKKHGAVILPRAFIDKIEKEKQKYNKQNPAEAQKTIKSLIIEAWGVYCNQ